MAKKPRPYTQPTRRRAERVTPKQFVDNREQQQFPPKTLASADYGTPDKPAVQGKPTDWGKIGAIAAIVGAVLVSPFFFEWVFGKVIVWNAVKSDIATLKTDDTETKQGLNDVKTDLTKVHGQVDHLYRVVSTQQAAPAPAPATKSNDAKKP